MTQRLVELSLRKSPLQVPSHVLVSVLEKVASGQMGMQVLFQANKEGLLGHKVLMHVRVTGLARKPVGQNCRH